MSTFTPYFEGYLFNIGMLKNVFKPVFTMHSIDQTDDWEVTTRWTMTMSLPPFPFLWKPALTFTGTSVMVGRCKLTLLA